ncbi:MAG: 30S ribosomal protein S20, partial [Alphaproteobacteria bacterium]|nr:30S ribosomal protein S20 [Alphaproteobacteria bacterium]
HKSAQQRITRNEKKRVSNKMRLSKIRSTVKKAFAVVLGKSEGDVKANLAAANSQLAKGARRGVVSKKKLARTMSKLAKSASPAKPAA